MKTRYRAYLELPAPHDLAADLLRDAQIWPKLPGGWESLGTLWRYDSDLYRIDMRADSPAGDQMRWEAAPVTGQGTRATLTITLHDGAVSTHAEVEVVLDSPGPAWPWRQMRLGGELRRRVAACYAELSAELRRRLVREPALMIAGDDDDDDDTGGPALVSRSVSAAQAALIDQLRPRYPQTVEHFLEMGAIEHLERVARLEAGWEQIMRGAYDASVYEVAGEPTPTPDFDLIYAGGGLGLLHAAVMAARYGRKVMVFDRSEVGCAHREWNISRAELDALVGTGVVSWDDLDAVVMREYRDGLVRFHSGKHSDVPSTDLWLPEVLNVAIDASALLRLMRRKLEDAGGTVLSGRIFRKLRVSTGDRPTVEVELAPAGRGDGERYSARLLLDGMGSTSPLALLRHAGRPFAGVCPTVGTVAHGFAQGDGPQEYDPTLGDILVSVADSQSGEQLMWEGFPGRGDELTVYLFYYSAIRRDSARSYSMLDLFEQYFTLLPTYKQPGPAFRHTRPVYGYIPARHSLRLQEAPLLPGVLPVGDSAAQQSPLTFCGFGSHVRNLRRTAGLLDYALSHDLLDPTHMAPINAFQVNVSLNWVFSRFMEPWEQADDVNRLQNIFMRVLHEMGVETATRFFQDRMRWADYHPMLLGMMWHNPKILLAAWKVLGPQGILQWMGDYSRFTAAAATAAIARASGRRAEAALIGLADRVAPRVSLRLRARYAEWRSMGWV
ncbi:hypothetical protein K2Z83_03685 [Oscillochloris sp. ZM17-4]|uniref:NAD(P)/FAD-dependent oxidoreductase n=1 Tax=Oscillochloris sp. ZM17-4 TaxID=2866714 RepID=UPI001C72F9E8|nr:hypothetical protein [Oscillochloris sp. ZM17-4]MBX0326782.1 hypothetical protein [Oscillochloris sp. ZM17-4]